jgi:hypothetical protein
VITTGGSVAVIGVTCKTPDTSSSQVPKMSADKAIRIIMPKIALQIISLTPINIGNLNKSVEKRSKIRVDPATLMRTNT